MSMKEEEMLMKEEGMLSEQKMHSINQTILNQLRILLLV